MIRLVSLVIFVMVSGCYTQVITTKYLCPKEFQLIGKKCYYFSENKAQWLDSHFYCEILNSTLSKVDSYREQKLLKDFTTTQNQSIFKFERWIDGIYDWRQKQWRWGASGDYITFNWFSKKHVGDFYKWKCIILDGNRQNKWVAKKCTEKKPFICETDTNILVEFKLYEKKKKRKLDISKCSSGEILNLQEEKQCTKLLGRVEKAAGAPANFVKKPRPTAPTKSDIVGWICPPHMISLGNRCYSFSTNESTWEEAHFECRKNKSKLAIIRNKSQDHNLRRFLNNFIVKHDRWIGGIYDWKSGQWKWALTGQTLNYSGFATEIIRKRTIQDLEWNAIYMDPRLDNRWNADSQMKRKRFICQVKAKAVKKFNNMKSKSPQATITITSQ